MKTFKTYPVFPGGKPVTQIIVKSPFSRFSLLNFAAVVYQLTLICIKVDDHL